MRARNACHVSPPARRAASAVRTSQVVAADLRRSRLRSVCPTRRDRSGPHSPSAIWRPWRTRRARVGCRPRGQSARRLSSAVPRRLAGPTFRTAPVGWCPGCRACFSSASMTRVTAGRHFSCADLASACSSAQSGRARDDSATIHSERRTSPSPCSASNRSVSALFQAICSSVRASKSTRPSAAAASSCQPNSRCARATSSSRSAACRFSAAGRFWAARRDVTARSSAKRSGLAVGGAASSSNRACAAACFSALPMTSNLARREPRRRGLARQLQFAAYGGQEFGAAFLTASIRCWSSLAALSSSADGRAINETS